LFSFFIFHSGCHKFFLLISLFYPDKYIIILIVIVISYFILLVLISIFFFIFPFVNVLIFFQFNPWFLICVNNVFRFDYSTFYFLFLFFALSSKFLWLSILSFKSSLWFFIYFRFNLFSSDFYIFVIISFVKGLFFSI